MLRIGLYLLTNFLVLMVAGFVLHLAGAMGFLGEAGAGPYLPWLLMAAVLGFGGSFVSLALSKWIAKRSTGARTITEPQNATEQWLVATVARQAQAAGIGMPEVAVYPAPEMNAFATGMRKNAALVAVSDGLLQRMEKDEVEAVLAHEISHVANGDMVTLSLIQGVLNTFVIFLSRVVASVVDGALSRRGRGGSGMYFLIVMVLQMVFGILASMVVMAFSRWREFRADRGAAKLEGPEKMIAALEALKRSHPPSLPENMQAFGILGRGGIMGLFRSHPPLESRIAELKVQARYGG